MLNKPNAAVPDSPLLLTGASGALGRVLARQLTDAGWSLRLTDINPFPDPVPANASFIAADLADAEAVLQLAAGCGTILHFGGIADERSFETILQPNISGVVHVYEAARRAKARVVFASSNHVVGFHDRAITLDDDCEYRPDGFYGLSKAYGELTARLYWDKHGVESVILRIGSAYPEPTDARMLATWLSYRDLVALVERAIRAPSVGCSMIWAASNNSRTWWRRDARAKIGWAPADSADQFANKVADKISGDPVAERCQGGSYCAIDYSRLETEVSES
jgi:uronate dehydrogenase